MTPTIPIDQLRRRKDRIDRNERTAHYVPARKDHIGWVILDHDETYDKTDFETAAWSRSFEIKAGQYPVYSISGHIVFYVDDALVIEEHLPNLFGGVPVGTPQKKTNVGKTMTIFRDLPDVYRLPITDSDAVLGHNRRLVLLTGVSIQGESVELSGGRLTQLKRIVLPDGRTIR